MAMSAFQGLYLKGIYLGNSSKKLLRDCFTYGEFSYIFCIKEIAPLWLSMYLHVAYVLTSIKPNQTKKST